MRNMSAGVRAQLHALYAAGIGYEKTGRLHYRVEGGFSYWPSTDRWRSFDGRVSGYGVDHLIEAVRARARAIVPQGIRSPFS